MRRPLLIAVNDLFQVYRFSLTVVWLVGLPAQVVMLTILLPRGPKFWLGLLSGPIVWTVCFLLELVLFRFLKTIFHERVLRALKRQDAPGA